MARLEADQRKSNKNSGYSEYSESDLEDASRKPKARMVLNKVKRKPSSVKPKRAPIRPQSSTFSLRKVFLSLVFVSFFAVSTGSTLFWVSKNYKVDDMEYLIKNISEIIVKGEKASFKKASDLILNHSVPKSLFIQLQKYTIERYDLLLEETTKKIDSIVHNVLFE